MTGKQVRAIRRRLGLTQGQFGYALRTTGNTVARWERDEVAITPQMELLIQYVAREAGVDVALNSQRSSSSAEGKRAHAKAPKTPSRKVR
jgi:transcriptional regulator with XRE-family HTH domain